MYFRVIGLCLVQNEICPILLNRHVIKFLLGRPVSNDFTWRTCNIENTLIERGAYYRERGGGLFQISTKNLNSLLFMN